MSVASMMRTELGKVDWLGRADRIAGAIAEAAARHDADESFVSEGYQLLKEEGFFTALVPAELGGGGAGHGEVCHSIRRIATSCGATALAFSMHSHLVAAEDLILVSSGGSDWLKSAGTATKTDGGYLINARKIFSSGSPMGDLLVTSAVCEDPGEAQTVVHFAVPMNAKGVTILDTWHVLGMRGSGSHDTELKNVFVPDAAISGRRPQGKWHMLFHVISMIAFPLIYSAYLGVAEGARAKALEIARKKPDDGNLAYLVGEMENAFAAATMAVDQMVQNAETAMP